MGAIGLQNDLLSAAGAVVDGVVVSDTPTVVVTSAPTTVQDTVVMEDAAEGERFRKSDYRHIERHVYLDDAIQFVTIMD